MRIFVKTTGTSFSCPARDLREHGECHVGSRAMTTNSSAWPHEKILFLSPCGRSTVFGIVIESNIEEAGKFLSWDSSLKGIVEGTIIFNNLRPATIEEISIVTS